MAHGDEAAYFEGKAEDWVNQEFGPPVQIAIVHALLAISNRLAELEKTLGTRNFGGERVHGNF
jgi:hypothetical protein